MTRPTLTPLLALLLWLGIAHGAFAAESYDNCTGFITTLSAMITAQGTWCLKQDLASVIASGMAITVNTNNVTIDCNNFKLGGLAAGAGTGTIGIYLQDRVNATVRHCNIRRFYAGVFSATADSAAAIRSKTTASTAILLSASMSRARDR